MTDPGFAWRLRLSQRAKRPRITIDAYGTVELVWPQRMARRYIPAMLQEHAGWVLKHLSSMDVAAIPCPILPRSIVFQTPKRGWTVEYRKHNRPVRVRERGSTLEVTGDVSDKEQVRQALLRWVKKQGSIYLKPRLKIMAETMGISYASVSIRLQKSRWGSCSAKRNLSLNAALLFLPDPLVRHVLIHELTHLKHLNHSNCFWHDVARFDPDYQTHRKQLKQYAKDIPAWLNHRFAEDAALASRT